MIDRKKGRNCCRLCFVPLAKARPNEIGGFLCDDCYNTWVHAGKARAKRDAVDRPVEPFSDEWYDQQRGM